MPIIHVFHKDHGVVRVDEAQYKGNPDDGHGWSDKELATNGWKLATSAQIKDADKAAATASAIAAHTVDPEIAKIALTDAIRHIKTLDESLDAAIAHLKAREQSLDDERVAHAQTKGAFADERVAHAQTKGAFADKHVAHAQTKGAFADERVAHAQTKGAFDVALEEHKKTATDLAKTKNHKQ